ncbi:MAG: bifunctional (p)ppGpp synthetase/guanosine-3',5'-bis(diphosphate) 3'-pyrophosphohydrolase [Bacteroidales bacterium]|nr:bifunctional (p)ppGpp synthetase/guanosine-3',5'-bis(diphosphate) 3'-pyrophosphohydrolase [Bacteroidales bacterium]
MKNKPLDTELLDRAIEFAVRAHAGTERRGKGFPYIVHPMEAMAIVATMTSDQELLAAAALHDVVEDTDIGLDEIRALFGDRVAALVQTESDRKDEALDWHARKQESLMRLSEASRDEKVVALGDKLSNMRAIARDYTTRGESFWDMFRVKDKSVHGWRYHALVEALSELKDTYAYQEFEFLVNRVFPTGE